MAPSLLPWRGRWPGDAEDDLVASCDEAQAGDDAEERAAGALAVRREVAASGVPGEASEAARGAGGEVKGEEVAAPDEVVQLRPHEEEEQHVDGKVLGRLVREDVAERRKGTR